FPPSNLISPSVRIIEQDLSFISPTPTGSQAGIVGFASKGPINIPTLITSSTQLHTTFGQPHPDVGDPYLLYAADQFLQLGNVIFVVRCADTSPSSGESASTANTVVPIAGGVVTIISNTSGLGGSPPTFSFANDSFFRWRLNGVLASKILVVLANNHRPAPNTGNVYTLADLVTALNNQLVPNIDGIQFYFTNPDSNGNPTSTSKLALETVFSYGTSSTLELVSVQNAIYGPSWNGTSFTT